MIRKAQPDFIIGGAPRSGTSWLYEALDSHPKISMNKPRQPEPKFFLDKKQYPQGADFYFNSFFSQAKPDTLLGEKTSNYLEKAPQVAPRIREVFPSVKLVFLLRNPIDRAWSNFLWSTQNGLETLSFTEALDKETEREKTLPERLQIARPYSYFQRGLYDEHLGCFLKHFPADQIHVESFERLTSEKEAFVCLCEFLNIDASLCTIPQIVNHNEIGSSIENRDMQRLREAYFPSVQRLKNMLKKSFSEWKEFSL